MDQQQDSNKTGRKFWMYLILFFVVFACVDAFFVYKALTTHSGQVERIHGK